ncbi:GH12055 [Drosophila grimshawi]|uniref:GH12055 n=1 Tax=Drosophila grimshawi TaxID=7222 RepID=B4JKG0_DROGR|nr:GH12055 [Drosophila grimshawi]
MKVTVCFGDLRILVPCGPGELLVRDLISEATRRYKKAAGKVSNLPRTPCPPPHPVRTPLHNYVFSSPC